MAEDRDDLVLRLLREMRDILNDHGNQLGRLTKGVEETRESVITALGFAAHANVQYQAVDKRLDEELAALTKRVAALENAR